MLGGEVNPSIPVINRPIKLRHSRRNKVEIFLFSKKGALGYRKEVRSFFEMIFSKRLKPLQDLAEI